MKGTLFYGRNAYDITHARIDDLHVVNMMVILPWDVRELIHSPNTLIQLDGEWDENPRHIRLDIVGPWHNVIGELDPAEDWWDVRQPLPARST